MKLTIRTVRGESFEVEVEIHETAGSVKQKIDEVKSGEGFEVANQVLVFKGQILKDDVVLETLDIKEKDFMVVTVSKQKKQPQKPTVQDVKPPEPIQVEEEKQPQASTEEQPQAASDQGAVAGGSSSDAQTYSSAASALARGSELETAIKNICEMGFEVEEVKKAMRAAFNNPERAVEYLMNGIPEGLEQQAAPQPVQGTPVVQQDTQQQQPQQPQQPPQQQTYQQQPSVGPNAQPLDLFAQSGGQGSNPAAGAVGGAGSLDFLRNNPQFQMIRTLVRTNPAVLEHVLAELGKHNPQLLQTINAHQQEFLQLINEQPTQDEQAVMQQMEQDVLQQLQDAVQGQLSAEDEAAVTRLQQLGFDRNQCVEAYLACDKNEELAANYLLENALED
eukprot:TRINITY_DN864_c0_g1_i4.p2 TRINITY_DN864_c0_g1~~TRINITY_DN864_c0_g1_i4.p2  ORF type:complete len:390 (-),score=75.42 TRINITY_DN864_c0_g1_i4:453-1622(-)